MDGSNLQFINAEQINVDPTDGSPVSNEQFDLLSNLRETVHPTNPRLSFGQVQDQLDEKQKRSNVLDDIDTSSANVSSNDLLIWKDIENGWELLTEAEGEVTASRVEFGDYFINGAGINGQFWSSDGSGGGLWRTLSAHFIIDDSTLAVRTGTSAGDIVELEIGAKLPAVDGSQLLGLNAYQLNDSMVSNEEYNMLQGVRTISGALPGGKIQTQLDTKAKIGDNSDITSITGLTTMLAVNQGGTGGPDDSTARVNLGLVIGQDVQQQSVHLQDLADDGILDADRVEHGEYFITTPGNNGWQWTSDGTDEGYWAPGGDIAHVYTDADRGLIINLSLIHISEPTRPY